MKTPRLDSLIAQVMDKLEILGRGAQANLARHLDVAPHHVTRWLTRAREPSAENTLALQEWLQIRVRRREAPKAKP